MTFYPELKRREYGPRCAERLLDLRAQLRREIPTRSRRDTLLLATWNIRDFDSNKYKHGPRLPESFFYIAEIISAFDVVAVQEVYRNLRALKKVMGILGPDWDYMVTDVAEGQSGNLERMAFVFDRSKVLFRNQVGEVALPREKLISGEWPFARTPFFVSFQSGWFAFNLCTVHIYFGDDSGEKLARRVAEIGEIARFLSRRAKKEPGNFVLLGDFNITSPEHETMQALVSEGWTIPPALQGLPTNMFGTKLYDQIAFKTRADELQLGDSPQPAGAFNYYASLFRDEDFDTYFPMMPPDKRETDEDGEPLDDQGKHDYYTKKWRSWQMSDHLPLWVELKVDFSDRYLEEVRGA